MKLKAAAISYLLTTAEEFYVRDGYWFVPADHQGRVPNKSETVAVLKRRYTDVRHALSALNADGHSLNKGWSSGW